MKIDPWFILEIGGKKNGIKSKTNIAHVDILS